MSRRLTQLGKWLRAFRIDNDLLLKDMANDLELSPAHLSGIETGRKPVPRRFGRRVIDTYDLNANETEELLSAIDRSSEDFKIRAVEPDRRDVAAVLARRFNELSAEDVEEFRNLLARRFS